MGKTVRTLLLAAYLDPGCIIANLATKLAIIVIGTALPFADAQHLWIMLSYEKRIAKGQSFKDGPGHFPASLPKDAYRVRYRDNHSLLWLGSSAHCLRFRLPRNDAISLRLELTLRYSSTRQSPAETPKWVPPRCETLLWDTWTGYYSGRQGIWYHPGRHEFIFYNGVTR